MKKTFKAALLGSVFLISAASNANAGNLADDVAALMSSHDRVRAAQADLDAARSNADVARGAYYPTASVTANLGNENIETQNPDGARTNSSMAARELDLNLTQTVWDFGATSATVDGADLAVNQAEINLQQARSSILLNAVSAQLRLSSAARVLAYREQSEASIKRQTELENARVQRGSGFSTDVLQAKAQLAGAQAERVRAQGALQQAVNRYRAIFGDAPADLNGLEEVKLAAKILPDSEGEAVQMALEGNPQSKLTAITAKIAKTEIERTVASNYRPVFTASADQKYKRDVGGTMGDKNETLLKVEMTYNFNFGWTAANTLKASKSSHTAATSRAKDTRVQIEEQARNAWQNLQTARESASFLENQTNIAAEFLELARKERTLGQRSLIDVLSGETSFMNAQAAADRARTEVNIATLTLLNIMGQLDTSVLQ
ncbi:TolC family protein [Pseudomonadota bacterium]